MCPPLPVRSKARFVSVHALALGATALGLSGFLGGCALPEAKLANLRELHQPDGALSYRGNLHNDVTFMMSRWVANFPINFEGLTDDGGLLAGLDAGEETIEDPCTEDLENLNKLARIDSSNLLWSGYQIEAFGWLGPDDQYVLGRERSVMELGKAARRLDVSEPLVEPNEAAGPEDLSGVLADLARAVLGEASFLAMLDQADGGVSPNADDTGGADAGAFEDSTTTSQPRLSFAEARAALDALSLDRYGALRVLALCDALFARQPARLTADDATSLALRQLALDVQSSIVAMALAEVLDDPAPIVRAAAVRAVAGLNSGPPIGLLKLAATDPSWEVSSAGLAWVAEHGLPLQRVPEELQATARAEWIQFLVGQCQSPDTRLSYVACRALNRVVPDGPRALQAEEWTTWWRLGNPDAALPQPLVARTAPGVEG